MSRWPSEFDRQVNEELFKQKLERIDKIMSKDPTDAYDMEKKNERLDRGEATQVSMSGLHRENFLIEHTGKIFSDCLQIIRKKNNDYAGMATPWKNFETVSRVDVSVQLGIFIRFLDKVTRLENLLKPEPTTPFVLDEKIEDTIKDAINYLAILLARREYEKFNTQKMRIIEKDYLSLAKKELYQLAEDIQQGKLRIKDSD